MKIKVYIIPLVIFSLLLVGAKPIINSNSPSFFDLNEQAIIENGDFIENGVKMNYSSKLDIETEYERLIKELASKYNIEVKDINLSSNKITYNDKNKSIKIVLWNEENETKVEMIYTNNNNSKSSILLKKEMEELQDNNCTKQKYCSFVKGKIIKESYEKIEEVLKNSVKKDTLEVLDIHNGYTATAMLKDGQRINIGYMKYDLGRQIIIGTPVIFTTY